MKKIIFILGIIHLITINLLAQATLDPRYHTYDEIITELNQYEQDYPDIAKVYQIGITNTDNIPIYALKISDNVATDEDQPAVMFAGQCHAEEVLGVEVVMYMIDDILNHRYQTPYRYWITNEEIWFVPTYNPEGLSVVMDGLDVTYRKNKTDTNNNGVFDYVPGQGSDIDGVDLNRNYSFNWVHGDTLYTPGDFELYDYYRGPYPFSEGGTQAIKNLADSQYFLFSINWHSSRTGNHSEKLHYSFEWEGEKRCPDFEENQTIGEHVASLIHKEGSNQTYEPSPSRGRKGLAHDWFYQQYGTFQYLIECGTSNIQPPADIVDHVCEQNALGAYYLLNRAIGYQTDRNMLKGHITDAQTGEPISAEIKVLEKDASYFAPRKSDSLYGSFYRILEPGVYNLQIKKKGYQTLTIENVNINASSSTNLNIQLEPLPQVDLSGSIKAGSQYLNSKIYILGDYPDTIYCENGTYHISTYQGEIHMIIDSEGFFPIEFTQYYDSGNHIQNFNMENENIIWSDGFEDGLENWVIDGTWYNSPDAFQDNLSLSTSMEPEFYANNMNISITSPEIFVSANDYPLFIEFYHKYHTENDNDICTLEISYDNDDYWQELARYSGVKDFWSKEFIKLTSNQAESFRIRFRFQTDDTLVDPGWFIDNFRIVNSTGTSSNDDVVGYETSLFQNYPNPFVVGQTKSLQTKIKFNLSKEDKVSIKIFNLKGQLINTILNETLKSGKHLVYWNGKDKNNKAVSSGVYFYKLKTSNKTLIKKMIVIR